VASGAIRHLVLLLIMAQDARSHRVHRGLSEKSGMGNVRMALHAFHVMSQMGCVVYLVSWILGFDVAHIVAFLAGLGVNLCAQNGALVFSCHAFENVTCAIEMGLELSNDSWFGMASDAIGL
jgi:hypothetical protein